MLMDEVEDEEGIEREVAGEEAIGRRRVGSSDMVIMPNFGVEAVWILPGYSWKLSQKDFRRL